MSHTNEFQKAPLFRGVLFLFAALQVGCATYQNRVEVARDHLRGQRFDQAISELEPLAKKENDDQLVYLFDYATALQAAGRYKESTEYFHLADRLAEQKNYLSLSRFTGSLLLSEEFTQYKGEDYERLMINVMAALNYIMSGDRESAMVEVRRLTEKLEYYRIEEKKAYEQNTAAIYLNALMWEADKNWDSAYIDFERAYKRDPSIPYLREDLVRAARRAGRFDEAAKWSKEFGIQSKPEWKDKNLGELVLIYQQGWGPRKAERPRIMTSVGFVSPGFPTLVPVVSSTNRARLEIIPIDDSANSGKSKTTDVTDSSQKITDTREILKVEESQAIYSVQDTSIKTLEDAYAPLIAKRIAAYVAKHAVAQQVGKNNEGLGAIVGLAMQIADRADLRQWSTLPETIQVAKVYLKPGKYRVNIRGLTSAGANSGEHLLDQEIEIRPQQKSFLSWRSFN